LDFGRGVDAFMKGMSATSVHAMCRGFEQAGIKLNQGIGITADLFDARSLFLTANTTTVYVVLCVDLKDRPIVVRVPPRVHQREQPEALGVSKSVSKRHAQEHRGPTVARGFELKRPMNEREAFPHPEQSEPFRPGIRRFRWIARNASAVVFDNADRFLISDFEDDPNLLCFGVTHDVRDCFLHNAIDRDFDIERQTGAQSQV
jgi:hypothetical protein